ncbi:hypothetical protein [Tautonia sociabilis]|uniref:Uncharacterized protein n=1 Tax=Tautonia sociabilis TaxID=2080755 RepID=A0A432MEB7_9BACT|nr:hypothetical protein [Tautonia sociabilis]RUL83647.1 hypothetical protein TsocGM_21680 [Tautonia sociabilis]
MMNRADRPPLLSRLLPSRARWHVLALLVVVSAILPTVLIDRSLGQPRQGGEAAIGSLADASPDRDVAIFGLRAEPGSNRLDPLLSTYAAPLRRLLPDHGLTLLGSASRRLSAHQSLRCDLGDGRVLKVTLKDPLDDGKVHLCVQLLSPDRPEPVFLTQVRTPAGQLVFLDKSEPGSDAKLLIGVGAR